MKWFRNLKISYKISLACMIFILLIVGVSIQGIYSSRRSSNDFQSFYTERFIPVRELYTTMKSILEIELNMIQEFYSAKNGNWDEVNRCKENSRILTDAYTSSWNAYKNIASHEREKVMIREWEDLVVPARNLRMKYYSALEEKNFITAEKDFTDWKIAFERIIRQTEKIMDIQQEVGNALMNRQTEYSAGIFYFSIALLAFSLALGFVISLLLARSISKPVNEGLNFSKRIADGDLTTRIELDRRDELGLLAASLNTAVDNLEMLITNVITSSQNLVQAVEQISAGNQNLSQRTSEQASSIEEIASTIEEAASTITQNAGNSSDANRASKNAVEAIRNINDKSKRIVDIIGVINEIAFQTNLLALNAAVEAARAGDQGRGFAVVAGEVRNLAQRSANSAKEIEALIRETVEGVQNGTKLVNDVSNIVSEIALASEEQKQGINQINIAISEMDSMTQQNASLVEETASASEEMANQAQELMDMVSRFKVNGIESMGLNFDKRRQIGVHTSSDNNSQFKSRNCHSGKVINPNGNGRDRSSNGTEIYINESKKCLNMDVIAKEGFEEF